MRSVESTWSWRRGRAGFIPETGVQLEGRNKGQPRTLIHMTKEHAPRVARVARDERISIPLHIFTPENGQGLAYIVVGKALEESAQSQQAQKFEGVVPTPAKFVEILLLRHANVHHAAALNTKTAALTGLGFKGDEVYEKLDPLTEDGIQPVMDDITEDFCQTGNGLMEVVRSGGGAIVGLHHLPVQNVAIWKEHRLSHDYHYLVSESSIIGLVSSDARRFARFGDRARMVAWAIKSGKLTKEANESTVSEVIHFRQSTSLSKHWGLADWLASIPIISMVQAEQQCLYDLFINGGVADQIVSFLGDTMDEEDWKLTQDTLTGGEGRGNKRKMLVLNLPQPDLKVQVDKLATDFAAPAQIDLDRNMAFDLMSAHGVPPMVASVVHGSKLGNNREAKDQINLFQLLNIGPKQNKMVRILERTLGSEIKLAKIPRVKQEVAGVSPTKSSEMESGWTFKRITEEVNMSDAESTQEAKENGALGGNPKQSTSQA